MSRHVTCDRCGQTADLTPGHEYPNGWTPFEPRMPRLPDVKQGVWNPVDLCGGCMLEVDRFIKQHENSAFNRMMAHGRALRGQS